jgi:hypothetical protein
VVSARTSAAEAGEPGAAGLLLGHGLVVLLVLGPGLRGLALGGDGPLLAVVAQVRGVSRGVPHPAGSMAFQRAS